MRGFAPGLLVALAFGASGTAAQERLLAQSMHLLPAMPAAPRAPIVTVAPVMIDDGDSMDAIRRATERITDRLRPIEQRLREDDRLRRAGTVVGVSAVALGALRGTRPLTFAGTQALRFGLEKQLTTIQKRSGFVVEPSIGHRGVSVTFSKKFDE